MPDRVVVTDTSAECKFPSIAHIIAQSTLSFLPYRATASS